MVATKYLFDTKLKSWFFRNSDITQIRVSQFSTNPNVVRVVFYHTANFNPKNISVINVKGNYLFKYGELALRQSSFTKSYRSARSDDIDYLEKTVYISQSEINQPSLQNQPTNQQQELTNVNS